MTSNTGRYGGTPNMIMEDKDEIGADIWSGNFIPCTNTSLGFVLDFANSKSGPLKHVNSPSSSIDLDVEKYVILQAFARPVWYSLFAILVLISFLLHMVLRIEEAVVHAGSEAPPWETSEVLLVTIGAICQQGSHRHPDTAAARTIFTSLFALSVIMYTAYSAAFVALLSPPVHHNDHAEIMNSLDEERFQAKILSVEELTSVILKNNVFFCTTKPDHNHTFPIHSGKGDGMPESLGKENISKNQEFFEDYLLNLARNGQSAIISLTMEDAYPAFLLLISGTVAAVVILIIEIVRHGQILESKFKSRTRHCPKELLRKSDSLQGKTAEDFKDCGMRSSSMLEISLDEITKNITEAARLL